MKGNKLKLIGPFRQLITMNGIPLKGRLSDDSLEIISEAGILVKDEVIEAIGPYRELSTLTTVIENVAGDYAVIPGLVDVHTHICWAGSRAGDYAMRLAGKSYLEIAMSGGGIGSTVLHTRKAGRQELAEITALRANRQLSSGVTTMEVKSGYGLNPESELKILEAIVDANNLTDADLVSTCLAAHIKPKDFNGTGREYLEMIVREVFPEIKKRNLANRIDIYIDEGAFTAEEGRYYLNEARKAGFRITIHADQFFRGGLQLAVESGALSADHLEASTDEDIRLLAGSDVIPVALPGASMGLGCKFAPARELLDAGTSLVIASDWNPGTAPMGNLLMQASVLGAYEKLSMAETLAAITCRASRALALPDRGILISGMLADFVAFPCNDYHEIIYNQGSMRPVGVWKKGKRIV